MGALYILRSDGGGERVTTLLIYQSRVESGTGDHRDNELGALPVKELMKKHLMMGSEEY